MDEGIMDAGQADDGKQFQSTKKLPGIQLFSMSLAVVVESCHITICYTIGVYMVHHFLDKSADESQIGTLTGLLSSFYSLAQLTTAFAWGLVSDRYGRKQLIVMSNLFSTISMLMFGLAGNYVMAALSRAIGGWFNCSFTNVRSMIGESTDFSSQTVAMGYLGTAFGVGVILGPLIGGALAYPCDNFGSSFPLCGANQLNAQRPFFLPCLGAAVISAVATLSNIVILKETLPRVVEARAAAHAAKLQDEEQPLLQSNGKDPAAEPAADSEGAASVTDALDAQPARSQPKEISESAEEPRSALTAGLQGHQPIPTARSRPASFQSRASMGASPDDVPWFQVGTPFLVSTEISASVADDIVEYQQDRRSRASHSVPGHSDEPEPSRPKTFMRRLASEAAAAPLEAADVDSDCFDPYDARGSKAVRRPPNQARSSAHRPMRRPAPSRVSLLSRSLPEDGQSMLTSAFAASEQQDAPGNSPVDLSLGISSNVVPSGESSVSRACAAISEAEPTAQSSAAEQQTPKDADDPAGAKDDDDAEAKWYKDPVVLLGVGGYTMICFMFNMLDELTPIFAAAPISRGGLDFSSSQLSLPLSISGVALMVWSLVFFPIVQRCLGARACAVFGLASTVFLSVALGCTSYLAKAHSSVSGIVIALTFILVLKACVQQLCFPTSMAIVNRFAPPSKRGAVNGTAQSLASGVRALGPFLGGLMWAVFSGLPGPGSQLIPFIIISLTAAGTIIIYYFLPAI